MPYIILFRLTSWLVTSDAFTFIV